MERRGIKFYRIKQNINNWMFLMYTHTMEIKNGFLEQVTMNGVNNRFVFNSWKNPF